MSVKDQALIGALTAAFLVVFAAPASAQVAGINRLSVPTYGGTVGLPPPPTNPFSTLPSTLLPIHKTATGQPCVSVAPLVVKQISNPNIVNHIVLLSNACGQTLKIQVCYYQSTSDCIVVNLNGYQRLQRVLGIAPGVPDFRYEFREIL